MKSKIKILILIGMCSILSLRVWGQLSSDPFESIYTDLNIWDGRGYISYLPEFRPLPEVILITAIKEVINKGDLESQILAKRYLKLLEVNNFGYLVSGAGRFDSVLGDKSTVTSDKNTDENIYVNLTLEMKANIKISQMARFSASWGLHAIGHKNIDEELVNMRKTYFFKHIQNRAEELENIYIATLSGFDAYATFSSRTSFSLGDEYLFLHTGFMRRSIGVFHDDGVIVSPYAPQSPNLIVQWRLKNNKIAIMWSLFSLSSSQYLDEFSFDSTTNTADYSRSNSKKLNKFFIYNAIVLNPSPKFEMSIFESIMFGQPNLGYFLPIKVIYSTDSLSNFVGGNLFTGFNFKIKPIDTLTIPISIVIDDISVSEYIKFNFYSKLKAAAEIAAVWNPVRLSPITQLRLGYQIVTPYTYTHQPSDGNELYSTAYNQADYTHFGQHFATSLDPSSHRLYLDYTLKLFRILSIGGIFRIEQHNNPSVGYLNGFLNDGSIIDDGYQSVFDEGYGKDDATFQKRFDFLSGTLETKYEVGINLRFDIPFTKSSSFFGLMSYTYSYFNNYKLNPEVKQEGVLLFDFGVSIKQFLVDTVESVNYQHDSSPLKYE